MKKKTVWKKPRTLWLLLIIFSCASAYYLRSTYTKDSHIKSSSKVSFEERPSVTIYSRPSCPYCVKAKRLLMRKDITFDDINISSHPHKRKEMIERSGGASTVPQIFIGNYYVGGSDSLLHLENVGRLDELLEGNFSK